jgi:hypothetical protein
VTLKSRLTEDRGGSVSTTTATIALAALGFVMAFALISGKLSHHAPAMAEGVTAEGRAKIAAYQAEESVYWRVMRTCDPDAPLGGMLCDHTMDELARLQVKHSRWTIARDRKFGDYDLEAQWILAHAE